MSTLEPHDEPWNAGRGRVLLRIARESLAEALGIGMAADYREAWLQEPGATFVTLTRWGELRGCVGSIRAYRPLFDDVWLNARASAFHDARFPPVERDEMTEIAIEISLLSSPSRCLPSPASRRPWPRCAPASTASSWSPAPIALPFLPQVWEQLPDPAEFLAHLKHKAVSPPASGRRTSGFSGIR